MAPCAQCAWDPERVPKRRWIVQIDGAILSGNKLGGNTKRNHTYRKTRAWYEHALKEQLSSIPHAAKFRVGIITRYYAKGRRAYDYENMSHGCKPLVDTLRAYGVIVNDNPGYWKGYYHQESSPTGVDAIRIEILEY